MMVTGRTLCVCRLLGAVKCWFLCCSSQFKAYAIVDGSGDAEEPMDIVVNVIDQNDNKPTFVKDTFLGEVAEASPRSTVSWAQPDP